MSDLVERLRSENKGGDIGHEAADRIEELEAERDTAGHATLRVLETIAKLRIQAERVLNTRIEKLEIALNRIANGGLSGTYAIGIAVNALAEVSDD